MKRVQNICPGDCANCTLLAKGEVDMIPCALDQILRRVIKLETKVADIQKEKKATALTVAALNTNEEENV